MIMERFSLIPQSWFHILGYNNAVLFLSILNKTFWMFIS